MLCRLWRKVDIQLLLFGMQPMAAGCIIAWSAAVPSVFSQLVLIFPTSEGRQAESPHLVLFNREKPGA